MRMGSRRSKRLDYLLICLAVDYMVVRYADGSEVGADEFEPRCLSSLLMRSESEVVVGNFSWAHHWFTTGTPFAYHQINASKEVSVE